MDAQKLGTFIAERRKELGFTQAALAERLHVTDKAISRWERGIGLPDIGNIEPLADALKVSLVELMQARRNDSDNISAKEAEKLLIETVQLSKKQNKIAKVIGTIILAFFAIIAAAVICVLISDWKIVIFSVGSIITGLIAWGIPVWKLTVSRTYGIGIPAITSLGFALISLMIQFLDIANEFHMGDIIAVEDTIDGLVAVIFVFVAVTLILNVLMAILSSHDR